VTVGTPLVEGASVAAEIVEHGLSRKIVVFKKKRRKNYRRKKGHRQPFTEIRITGISS
jgi:large subunit ribosomal protein L21